jgi:phage terminase small subunit
VSLARRQAAFAVLPMGFRVQLACGLRVLGKQIKNLNCVANKREFRFSFLPNERTCYPPPLPPSFSEAPTMPHTPPADLPDLARAKWAEIVGPLDGDTLTQLDLDTIRDYCLAHADEQAAAKLLGECPNPFIVAGDGAPYVNPLRKIIDTARAQMQRLRRELRGKLPSTAATLGENRLRLLVEILRRHLAIANDPNPGYGWADRMEFGPLFSAAKWFDCQDDDAARMRWTRAMADLIDEGLVLDNREQGCKWVNVRLSETGERAIADLDAA